MFFARNSHTAPAVFLLAGLISLLSACTTDENYVIDDISDIDPSMTVFENGVTIPLGSTEKISIGALINSAGEYTDQYIETGANGNLALSYDGTVSLNDKIEELDLANIAKIDGVSFSKDFNYHIGNFNTDIFTFGGTYYELKSAFKGIDVLDINLNGFDTFANGLTFQAGLEQYKDLIRGNEDLNLAKQLGDVLYYEKVFDIDVIREKAAASETEEIHFNDKTFLDTDIPSVDVPIKVDPISLHDDIIAIKNIQTDPNARMWVDIYLTNVCFTEGEIVPDISLDLSDLLHIKGGDIVNIKDMALSAENGWKASKLLSVEGLVKTDYEEYFSLDTTIPVTGSLFSNNIASTKTKVSQTKGDLYLHIALRFEDFAVYDADIHVRPRSFNLADHVSFGDYTNITLPDEITDVKKVVFDESRPIKFRVTPKNLNRFKEKDIEYTFTMNFPPAFEVAGATDGKLSFSGTLGDSPIEKEVVVKSISPTLNGNKISLDSEITVDGRADIKSLVLNNATLPQTAAEDISFRVDIAGNPAISDYVIVLDNYEDQAEFGDTLEMDVDGLGDFGSFHVKPVGTPEVKIKLDIPKIKGLSFKPGAGGVKLMLPDVMEFESSAIDPSLGFNATDNSIVIKDAFPEQILLPIKNLHLKPVSKGGKYVIETNYSVAGKISIPGTEISQNELKETFGSNVGLIVEIPEIKAESISLDDRLSFDINQKFNLTIQNLPKELKKIEEILLDNVYLTLDANFDGIPVSSTAPILVDLVVKLPDFIAPNSVPVKGTIKNGKFDTTPTKIEKLYNIDLTDKEKIEGEIANTGTLSAEAASLDLMQLKPDISAKFTASLQNSEGKIAVSKATGVFSYEISESTSMALDDIPEMLKDENICLDVANPRLDLSINTNLGIPLLASIEIVPYKNKAPLNGNILTLNNVSLPYSSDSGKTVSKTFSLCKLAAYAAPGAEFIEADLTGLLKQIPDSLVININASVDGTATSVLEPAAKYTLDIGYGIHVPLAFGSDFRFSTETELDLSAAVEITRFGEFGIKGKVLNDSPLNLKVEMELLDNEGAVITQKKPSVIDIQGSNTSEVEFYLTPAENGKTVSKARLKILVTAIPNRCINESDCLQFFDLVAVAPEGITIEFTK